MEVFQIKFKNLSSDIEFKDIKIDIEQQDKEHFNIIELLNKNQRSKKISAAGCSCDWQCTCEPHCYCHGDCRCERHCHCHSDKPYCSCEDKCNLHEFYFCGCGCDNHC